MRRLVVTVAVLALGIATAAAFTATEALKVKRAPVGAARFEQVVSPGCACPRAIARLSFKLRRRDTIDVAIVDSDGDLVRTLLTARPSPRGRIALRWGGRDEEGAVVRDGVYRVRVRLERADRTIVIPKDIRVEAAP